jgi:hypothetical protein
MMNTEVQSASANLKAIAKNENEIDREAKVEKVLCPHCQRTATNGIKCKGICVADNDY